MSESRDVELSPGYGTNPNEPLVNLTERQLQLLVTSIFESVNSRIAERIVQDMNLLDTKHVPSAHTVKAAIDDLLQEYRTDVSSLYDAIEAMQGKVGDGTDAAKTYTDEQISELRTAVMGMNHWDIVAVTGELPEELDDRTIYMQRDSEDDKTWEMFVLTSDGVVCIGNTSIDLENYWSKDNIDGIVNALFGSELFGTKMGELLSTALTAYTEETLDNRYWKKDNPEDLQALLNALLGGMTPDNPDTPAEDFSATIQEALDTIDALNSSLIEKVNEVGAAGGNTTQYTMLQSELNTLREKFEALEDPAREEVDRLLQELQTYKSAVERLEVDTEEVPEIPELPPEPETPPASDGLNLNDIYVQIASLKEYLSIEGDLTTDSVEQAILRIVNENEVESTIITDEQISAIVNQAFAETDPDLTIVKGVWSGVTELPPYEVAIGQEITDNALNENMPREWSVSDLRIKDLPIEERQILFSVLPNVTVDGLFHFGINSDVDNAVIGNIIEVELDITSPEYEDFTVLITINIVPKGPQ